MQNRVIVCASIAGGSNEESSKSCDRIDQCLITNQLRPTSPTRVDNFGTIMLSKGYSFDDFLRGKITF